MVRRILSPLISYFVLSVAVSVYASEAQKAVDLVKKAAEYMSVYGKENFMNELKKKNGRFCKGELYVFAYNTTGVMIAHPKNHKLIGVNLIDVPDIEGKMYRREMIKIAKNNGSGWVDYKYKNPEKKQVEFIAAYVHQSGDLVLCCGIHK
ncbi:MAG: cache type 2 domain-containing protein [Fibrobacter sp.]|nr:cache type 2 domain-containing protein [Fibrobacter sp.]